MKQKMFILFSISLFISLISCRDEQLPQNPTLLSPISGLVITINDEDYVATPQLLADGSFNDTLLLSVKQPNVEGIVKDIQLKDNTTASIKAGDTVTFIDNLLTVTVAKGSDAQVYYIRMQFNPPPFMYVIKSSDKDENGNRYFLDIETVQKIVSGSYGHSFEGYIDLTGTNWDNIGLVKQDLSSYFDCDGGWYPEVSSGLFTLTPKDAPGTGYFPCAGPWADWKWTGGNPNILSAGVWKFNFDASTHVLALVEVQWAITGSAAGAPQAMTYSSSEKIWSLNTQLSQGNLKFTTISVTAGDPVITYGELSSTGSTGRLSENGKEIAVSSAGNYTLELNFSNPPYYSYKLTKN